MSQCGTKAPAEHDRWASSGVRTEADGEFWATKQAALAEKEASAAGTTPKALLSDENCWDCPKCKIGNFASAKECFRSVCLLLLHGLHQLQACCSCYCSAVAFSVSWSNAVRHAECGCLHRCKEYSPARRLEHDAAQAAKEAAKPAKPNKRKSQAGSKDDEQQKKKTKKEKKEKKEKIMEEKRKRATEKGKEKEDEKEEGKKENVKKVEKKEKKEKNVEETTSPVDFAEKLKDKKKKKTETAELQISSAPLSAKRRERPAGLAPNRCYLLTVTPEDPKADPATKVYYCGECKIFEKGYQTWRAHMARSKKKAKKL